MSVPPAPEPTLVSRIPFMWEPTATANAPLSRGNHPVASGARCFSAPAPDPSSASNIEPNGNGCRDPADDHRGRAAESPPTAIAPDPQFLSGPATSSATKITGSICRLVSMRRTDRTATVESAVTEIVAKHMNKKQEMGWNRSTGQPSLAVRSGALNSTLEDAGRRDLQVCILSACVSAWCWRKNALCLR
jgi:hypothetical protein